MNFYTNFFLRGKNMFIRGVEDGIRFRRKDPVSPTLFVQSQTDVGFQSVFGDCVKPIQFQTPKEATEFAREMKSSGVTVFGFPRYEYREVDELYPGTRVEFDEDLINTLYLDIECESENGFPDPKIAKEKVNAITCGYVKNKKYCFDVFTIGDIDVSSMKYKPTNLAVCRDELDLLSKFVLWTKNFDPDIITGWNVEKFDMVYLVNRITVLLGEKAVNSLSPWGMVELREVNSMYGIEYAVDIAGVSILDYLDLYKKFTYTMQESYKLDHIASVELGETKLDYSEYGSLHRLYQENYTLYVDYNIKDVELIMRLEDKKRLINLACTIAYEGKTNYNDVFMNVRMWDVIISNYLAKSNVVVPYAGGSKKDSHIEGAFVKDPLRGKYEWVESFDLTSLYPSLIMQYNISPETMVNPAKHFPLTPLDVLDQTPNYTRAYEYAIENNCSLAGNGSLYYREKEGFLPELMARFFEQRSEAKTEMLTYENKIQEIDKILSERNV